MTRPRTLLTIAIVAAAVTITGAGIAAFAGALGAEHGQTVPAVGRVLAAADRPPAPVLTGPAVTGPAIDTTRLGGAVVVVNFWGSWCVPCRAEAPILANVATATKPLGVAFIGIDIKDNHAAAQGFTRQFHIPYPSIYDPAGAATTQFGALAPHAIPSTFIFDTHHHIAALFLGAVHATQFSAAVTAVAREQR